MKIKGKDNYIAFQGKGNQREPRQGRWRGRELLGWARWKVSRNGKEKEGKGRTSKTEKEKF